MRCASTRTIFASRAVAAGTTFPAPFAGAIRIPNTPLRVSAAARTIISGNGNGEDPALRGKAAAWRGDKGGRQRSAIRQTSDRDSDLIKVRFGALNGIFKVENTSEVREVPETEIALGR